MTPATEWTPAALADAPPLHDPGDTHLWLLALDDPRWPHEQFRGVLDASESRRADRFHFPHDARRYCVAHGLLRRALAHYIRLDPREIGFTLGAAGKPALAGRAAASGLTFNLSHSGGHALLGLTYAPSIGVDIEVVRDIDDVAAIAASHFAPGELRTWRALPAALRQEAFFAAWTRKEAYVKALGGGLSIPLTGFQVSLNPNDPVALLVASQGASAADRWTLWSRPVRPGLWAAAAIEQNPAKVLTLSMTSP